MTKEKALQVVAELGEVLKRHDVEFENDRSAGYCLEDWKGEGQPPNPFESIQFCDEGEWRLLEDFHIGAGHG
jgi:hypothetical protein